MALMGILTMTNGCATTASLGEARRYADKGEYYKARKAAELILAKNPNDAEAKKVIAEVIDQEVASHKELFETHVPEELTNDEQSVEVQALIERSHSLLDMGEYDEALVSAEKIFSYDPENAEASRLVDQIKAGAMKEGKAEMLIRNKIAKDEIDERVEIYLDQARKSLGAGRVGTARLALNKILLLQPENEEALKMRSQLDKKLKAA